MASVASQLAEEVTAHAQSDSLEDAREICADGTYFSNNLRIILLVAKRKFWKSNLSIFNFKEGGFNFDKLILCTEILFDYFEFLESVVKIV